MDFSFLQSIFTNEDSPDFSGYNKRLEREQRGENAETSNAKTNIFYRPLIDREPVDPSTMLTAMRAVEKATNDACQDDTVMTCDQQLFRVMVDII